jgi:hypothetical protein
MRTAIMLQREIREDALDLMVRAVHHGDTSRLNSFRRKLGNSARQFSAIEFKRLTEIERRVATLDTWKARYDDSTTPDADVETICDDMAAQDDWILAQLASAASRDCRRG